jgi:DNA mismatch endonuclease, patch repair protein
VTLLSECRSSRTCRRQLRVYRVDHLDSARRSQTMAAIRSKDTKPELYVKRWLWSRGFRYARTNWHLPGSPDLVFPSRNTVVFVHGCFWHGHRCPRGAMPATNTEFWEAKISKNKRRDRRSERAIRKLGWRCLIVWQCSIDRDLRRVEKALLAGKSHRRGVTGP